MTSYTHLSSLVSILWRRKSWRCSMRISNMLKLNSSWVTSANTSG
jgi:hypothetical protein